MSRLVIHLTWTWHEPSWHGGDIAVPACRSQRRYFDTPCRIWAAGFVTSDEPADVDCPRCRALLQGLERIAS